MGTSNRYTREVTAAFCMAVFFLSATAGAGNVLPAAVDINNLAQAASLTVEAFMQQSFELRLRYEFSGRFLAQDDKRNLHELARTAGDRLEGIATEQRKLKQQIDDYEGDDWDSRYGSTGLWRKLSRDICVTSLSKCEIDFYRALSAEPPQANEILKKVVAQADSLDQTSNTAYSQFLKAKSLAVLARTDLSCRPLSKKQFDLLAERADIDDATALRISLERIELLGPSRLGELENLGSEIAGGDCSGDIELVFLLLSLQRRYDRRSLRETIQKWPQIEDFVGSCVLSELVYQIGQGRLDLLNISVFEAELAAQAAWKNDPQAYKTLLDQLASSQEFQTPLILYVTATAFADSSGAKAVNFLIKAARLQQLQKSDRLQLSDREIAKQAAQLAYNLFVGDNGNCQPAIEAFENYTRIAGKQIDEELEYLYTGVLNICGPAEEGKRLLQRIVERPAGKWRNRARLDLVTLAVRQEHNEKHQHRGELLRQLSDLIADHHSQETTDEKLRKEALTVYCQLLLESKDKDSAQKILDAVTEADAIRDPNLGIFKSEALRLSGKLEESASCLLRAIESDPCRCVSEAFVLLSEIVGEIDRFDKKDLRFVRNCEKLAQICSDCLEGKPRYTAALFLIEISVFAATEANEELSNFEKLLDTIAKEGLSTDADFIRCKARLLAQQGKFDQAARLWAQVAAIRKSRSLSADRQSWKWWQARFFELCCRSKCPQTDKGSLLHTIEVLENSFRDIPPLWAQKLNSLKGENKR